MDEMLEPVDILKEVKRAFDTNLIGVADRLSIEKRLQVIELRIRIDKAIREAAKSCKGSIVNCSGASYEESR